MPKGKEDFYVDFRAIISYPAMCLWSLCLPVGCGKKAEVAVLVPASPGCSWLWWDPSLPEGTPKWSLSSSTGDPMPSLLGWHRGYHLEIPKTTEMLLSLLGHRSNFSRCLSALRTLDFQLCEENGALCLLPLPGRELRQQQGQGTIPGSSVPAWIRPW